MGGSKMPRQNRDMPMAMPTGMATRLASKKAPKKYGDKIVQEHTGADGGAIQVQSTVTFVRPPARASDE